MPTPPYPVCTNLNFAWAWTVWTTLRQLGVRHVVACPGSRSAPLALQAAYTEQISCHTIIDERSAGFVALGLAAQTGLPPVLLCTSGSAGAHFYPAVLEASQQGLPLVIITADRPAWFAHNHARQAFDQRQLYAGHVRHFQDLGLPAARALAFEYLQQSLLFGLEKALGPSPGPIHWNCPFEEPLHPCPDAAFQAFWAQHPFLAKRPQALCPLMPTRTKLTLSASPNTSTQSLLGLPNPINCPHPKPAYAPQAPLPGPPSQEPPVPAVLAQLLAPLADPSLRKLIVLGYSPHQRPYTQAIGQLSQWLQAPVLVDGVADLRHHSQHCPFVVSHYPWILKACQAESVTLPCEDSGSLAAQTPQSLLQALRPDVTLQIGQLPYNRSLEWFLTSHPSCQHYLLDDTGQNLDALHRGCYPLRLCPLQLLDVLANAAVKSPQEPSPSPTSSGPVYALLWQKLQTHTEACLTQALAALAPNTQPLLAPAIVRLLADWMPPGATLFTAASSSLRHVENSWPTHTKGLTCVAPKGLAGIDGAVSTCVGLAAQSPFTVGFLGDVTLAHDVGALALLKTVQSPLLLLVCDNQGGRIFDQLPLYHYASKLGPVYERAVSTPPGLCWQSLAAAHGIAYHEAHSLGQLQQSLADVRAALGTPGSYVHLLVCHTDSTAEQAWTEALQLHVTGSITHCSPLPFYCQPAAPERPN